MLYRDEKIRINFCSHTTYSIHTWIYKTRNVSHLNKTLYNVYSHEIVLENRRWCKVHSRYLPLFFTHTSDCVKASHFFHITASSIALVVWDGNHKHEYKTQTLLFKKKKKKVFLQSTCNKFDFTLLKYFISYFLCAVFLLFNKRRFHKWYKCLL